jgi:hypothetical protein
MGVSLCILYHIYINILYKYFKHQSKILPLTRKNIIYIKKKINILNSILSFSQKKNNNAPFLIF